jgi:uncharacterized protein
MAILIRQAAHIPSKDLHPLGPVKQPLSWPPAALVGKKYIDEIPGIDSMGIWECSPGRWQRTVVQEEFAHFIKGRARFIPADGDPMDIEAGDSIWLPANSAGVWEISEDVRKVYVIIDRPSLRRKIKSALKTMFQGWLGMPAQSTRPPEADAIVVEPPVTWRSAQGQLQGP